MKKPVYYNLWTVVCWSGWNGEGDFASWGSDISVTKGFDLYTPIQPDNGQAFPKNGGCPILVEVPHLIPEGNIFVLQPSEKLTTDFPTRHIAFQNIARVLKWVDPETNPEAQEILVQMIFRGGTSLSHRTLDDIHIEKEDIINYESGGIIDVEGTFIHNIVFILHEGEMVSTATGYTIVNNKGVLEKRSS